MARHFLQYDGSGQVLAMVTIIKGDAPDTPNQLELETKLPLEKMKGGAVKNGKLVEYDTEDAGQGKTRPKKDANGKLLLKAGPGFDLPVKESAEDKPK